jgi:cytoskeletal protein RodZ
MTKDLNETSEGNVLENGATVDASSHNEPTPVKPAATKVTMTVKETFNAARQAKEEGKWKLAQKYYEVLAKHNSKNWEAYFYANYCAQYPVDLDDILPYCDQLPDALAHTLTLLQASTMDAESKQQAVESIIKDIEIVSSKMITMSLPSLSNYNHVANVLHMLDRIGDAFNVFNNNWVEYAGYVWSNLIYLFIQKCCDGKIDTANEWYQQINNNTFVDQQGSSYTFSFETLVNKICSVDATYKNPFVLVAHSQDVECEEDSVDDFNNNFAVDNQENTNNDDKCVSDAVSTASSPQKPIKKKSNFFKFIQSNRRLVISILSGIFIIIIFVFVFKYISQSKEESDVVYDKNTSVKYTSTSARVNDSSEQENVSEAEDKYEEEVLDEVMGYEEDEETTEEYIMQNTTPQTTIEPNVEEVKETVAAAVEPAQPTTTESSTLTNQELLNNFKTYYNLYYGEGRADQDIQNVSIFLTKACRIMTDPQSRYKWLGDYIQSVASKQGYTLTANPSDNEGTMENLWRWHLNSFFNCSQRTTWPKTADFSQAGQREAWADAYRKAH